MSRGILSFKICAVNHLSVEANSRLLHLFARLIETQTENKYEPAETKDYALTAKSFMDDHFSEPIKIQDVADALHIHPNYLSQIFRKTYKQSPKAYLSSLRIHKAALLLDLTDYSISAISNFVGFNSQHHFAKAFRNTFGCSPTDYRNRKIKGGPFYETIPNYSLFSLAFPIAIEFLFQRLFGIADTMVLGNYADNAVAAVGYADQILSISLLIFQIISSGTSILLAQAIGARKKDLQKDICSASLVLSLLFGSITCIALLMLKIPLLKLLNVSAELQIHAADYLQIMAFSQFFPADTFKTILQLGIPAAGESCSYKFSQLIGTTIIGSLGADILTGKIYGMTFSSVMVLIPDSIAIATGVLVGVSAGENDFKRANSIVLSSIKKGAMAIVLVDIPLLLLGRYIINTFYTDNPLIQNTAYFVLCAEALTMFIKNFNLNLGNSLRAIKDVHYPVLISIISMWTIGTGLCWILGVPLGYGIIGIYIAFFLDESLRAYLLFRRWRQKISVH